MIKNLLQFLMNTVFRIVTFLLTWYTHVQKKKLYQRPLRTIYVILSLRISALLPADTILQCTKIPVPSWWYSFPFLYFTPTKSNLHPANSLLLL